jgi:hypothetical protein
MCLKNFVFGGVFRVKGLPSPSSSFLVTIVHATKRNCCTKGLEGGMLLNVGMLVAQPLEVVMLVLPLVDGVPCQHSMLLSNSFKSCEKIINFQWFK